MGALDGRDGGAGFTAAAPASPSLAPSWPLAGLARAKSKTRTSPGTGEQTDVRTGGIYHDPPRSIRGLARAGRGGFYAPGTGGNIQGTSKEASSQKKTLSGTPKRVKSTKR